MKLGKCTKYDGIIRRCLNVCDVAVGSSLYCTCASLDVWSHVDLRRHESSVQRDWPKTCAWPCVPTLVPQSLGQCLVSFVHWRAWCVLSVAVSITDVCLSHYRKDKLYAEYLCSCSIKSSCIHLVICSRPLQCFIKSQLHFHLDMLSIFTILSQMTGLHT